MKHFSIYRLVGRVLAHHKQAYFLMFATVALCTMVISGSLLIGSSVNRSLEKISRNSTGNIKTVLQANNSWILRSSAKKAESKSNSQTALIISANAYLAASEGRKSQKISLFGVDSNFFACYGVSGVPDSNLKLNKREISLNSNLADTLGIQTGDQVTLRYFQAAEMPGDAPMAISKNAIRTLSLKVAKILQESEGGNFDLKVSQQLPFNAFLDFEYLAELMKRTDSGNLLLSTGEENLISLIKPHLTLNDYGLRIQRRNDRLQITSDAVFISDYIESAFSAAAHETRKYFGCFVNSISADNKVVPYSFAVGIDEKEIGKNSDVHSAAPADWIIINEWTAGQLHAQPGDRISMSGYIPQAFGELKEATGSFILKQILPMEQALEYADFAPIFPGMNDADSCSNWDPDLPVNTDLIRDQDEEYWNNYKSLPKALISLESARKLWGNRFGSLTLLSTGYFPEFESRFLAILEPEKLGFQNLPVKDLKNRAVANSMDFSGLFIGLGFFVIIASLLLLALLFDMHLENRFTELGIMSVIGFGPPLLKKMLFSETLLICLTGAPAGAIMGILYAALNIHLLGTTWHGALNFSGLQLFLSPGIIIFAISATVGICFATVYLSIRKLLNSDLNELISGSPANFSPPHVNITVPLLLVAAAGTATFFAPEQNAVLRSTMFFLTGFTLLYLLTQLSFKVMASTTKIHGRELSTGTLATRNCLRRFNRSKATIRVLAAALFLVVGISANHRGEISDQWEKASGTGGYSIFAETALSLSGSLANPDTRQNLKLDSISPNTVFTQMPVLEGSEASCLNLNSVSRPTIVGIKSEEMQNRFSFAWQLDGNAFWNALDSESGTDIIPAIADADVIMWSLGLKAGDSLPVQSSDGRTYQLRFVAGLNNSIFQGKVLISAKNFYKLWPETAGSRLILAESLPASFESDMQTMTHALDRYGLEIETAAQRLNRFNRVQNTYLAMFLTMGSIALLLGCFAMAILLRRNLIDRKTELLYLNTLGFSNSDLHNLVFNEHFMLFATGSLSGLLSAAIAVYPVVASSQGQVPVLSIAMMIVVLFLIAILSIKLTLHGFFKSFTGTNAL